MGGGEVQDDRNFEESLWKLERESVRGEHTSCLRWEVLVESISKSSQHYTVLIANRA